MLAPAEFTPGAGAAALKEYATHLTTKAGEADSQAARALRVIAAGFNAYAGALELAEADNDAMTGAIITGEAGGLIIATCSAMQSGEAELIRLAEAMTKNERGAHVH
nr:hypothetical protein [Dechloromonas sp.]